MVTTRFFLIFRTAQAHRANTYAITTAQWHVSVVFFSHLDCKFNLIFFSPPQGKWSEPIATRYRYNNWYIRHVRHACSQWHNRLPKKPDTTRYVQILHTRFTHYSLCSLPRNQIRKAVGNPIARPRATRFFRNLQRQNFARWFLLNMPQIHYTAFHFAVNSTD